jgi:hypothetical protein
MGYVYLKNNGLKTSKEMEFKLQSREYEGCVKEMHIQPRYLSLDEILSGFYISVYSF